MAYASRSLTEAESRYAQGTLGSSVQPGAIQPIHVVHVESAPKPLEIIVKKPLATAPPRLQRILLRMQKYDCTLEYNPGRELVLPDMSRAPLPETTDINNMEEEIALHVHLIQSRLPVSKPKLEGIREEIKSNVVARNNGLCQ